MLRRRSVLAMSTAAAAVAPLAACGVIGTDGNENGGEEAPQEVTGPIEGAITFQTIQLSPTFDDFINGLIADFESEYPDVSVDWVDVPADGLIQKISADASSGNLPDVLNINVSTLTPLARDGRVLDMSQVAAEHAQSYIESAWESFRFGDQISALPWYINTPVLLMNSSILEEAGLDVETPPSTYEEMIELSEQIAERTNAAGFQPTVDNFSEMMLASGVPMLNEDGSSAIVDTPEALQLVERLAALYQIGGIPADSMTADIGNEIESFQEGRVAYLDSGPQRAEIIEENAPGTYDSLAVAEGLESEADGAWMRPMGVTVPNSSENQAAALEFALFVTNAENQLGIAEQSAVFPSIVDALEDPFFMDSGGSPEDNGRAIAANALVSGRTAPARDSAIDAEYDEELWSQMQLALTGDADPAEALASAEASLTQILEQRAR